MAGVSRRGIDVLLDNRWIVVYLGVRTAAFQGRDMFCCDLLRGKRLDFKLNRAPFRRRRAGRRIPTDWGWGRDTGWVRASTQGDGIFTTIHRATPKGVSITPEKREQPHSLFIAAINKISNRPVLGMCSSGCLDFLPFPLAERS